MAVAVGGVLSPRVAGFLQHSIIESAGFIPNVKRILVDLNFSSLILYAGRTINEYINSLLYLQLALSRVEKLQKKLQVPAKSHESGKI